MCIFVLFSFLFCDSPWGVGTTSYNHILQQPSFKCELSTVLPCRAWGVESGHFMPTFFLFVGSFREAEERKKKTFWSYRSHVKTHLNLSGLSWSQGAHRKWPLTRKEEWLGGLFLQWVSVTVLNAHLWKEIDKSTDERIGAFNVNFKHNAAF